MNKKILIGISAALILVVILILGKEYMLLIVPLFLLVWSVAPVLKSVIKKIPLNLLSKYLLIGLLFGLITESLAILSNLGVPAEQKILFHPNPFLDLLMGVGFYVTLALIWYFLLKRYSYKTSEVFILGGLWGVAVEQDFAVLLSFSIPAYLYVFIVYGSFITIPFLLLNEEFRQFSRKDSYKKYLFGFFSQYAAYIISKIWAIVILLILGKF